MRCNAKMQYNTFYVNKDICSQVKKTLKYKQK